MKTLILGGNNFFGKKLAHLLIQNGHEVTLLNRGNLNDGFQDKVERIKCDRKDFEALKSKLRERQWDIVYDQICFEATDAIEACQLFSTNTSHYVLTSSITVHGSGIALKEDNFKPSPFLKMISSKENYAEAKKQCEAVILEKKLPATIVRFPVVLGHDDSTKRFQFHIDRIQKGLPIFFHNLNAKTNYISSDDAAKTLFFLLGKSPVGSLNAGAAEPISFKNLMSEFEIELGKNMNLAPSFVEECKSPYTIKETRYMDVNKLKELGFEAQPVRNWLRNEIRISKLSSKNRIF